MASHLTHHLVALRSNPDAMRTHRRSRSTSTSPFLIFLSGVESDTSNSRR